MMRSTALALAALLSLPAIPRVAEAQPAPFLARETHPYECASMVSAPRVWSGEFFGKKEVNQGFIHYRTTREHACFVSERECRNWLYNMQSEYTVFVWRAECRPGLN